MHYCPCAIIHQTLRTCDVGAFEISEQKLITLRNNWMMMMIILFESVPFSKIEEHPDIQTIAITT